ncbi:MAG: hypothetical protein ACI8P0_004254, partial [Planctomycetaceae bacterium]
RLEQAPRSSGMTELTKHLPELRGACSSLHNRSAEMMTRR